MAKKEKVVVPDVVDSVETLEAKMKAMREAQKIFATFSQEQVDKIFYEAAMAANKQRIPLAKMAVEETQRGWYLILEMSFMSRPLSPIWTKLLKWGELIKRRSLKVFMKTLTRQ